MLLASEPPAMEACRVSREVNTPRNNREDLLLQVEGGRVDPYSTLSWTPSDRDSAPSPVAFHPLIHRSHLRIGQDTVNYKRPEHLHSGGGTVR